MKSLVNHRRPCSSWILLPIEELLTHRLHLHSPPTLAATFATIGALVAPTNDFPLRHGDGLPEEIECARRRRQVMGGVRADQCCCRRIGMTLCRKEWHRDCVATPATATLPAGSTFFFDRPHQQRRA
jgi:hypothetical protein